MNLLLDHGEPGGLRIDPLAKLGYLKSKTENFLVFIISLGNTES